MKVDFHPAVSFSSNLIDDRLNGVRTIPNPIPESERNMPRQYPTSWGPDPKLDTIKKETDEFLKKELDKIGKQNLSFEETLVDEDWEKTYLPDANIIHVRQKSVHDGKEFEIFENGKVLQVSTWQKEPKVIKESDKEIAEIFAKIKKGEAISIKNDDLSEIKSEARIQDFKQTLKSRKWEKTYLPESDVIWIKQKHVRDGVEYCLEKDGTVKETSPNIGKSEVIIEANRSMSEAFNEIKSKNTKPKKSIGYRIKDAIADSWKFLSASTTMAIATAKGAFYGLLSAAGVIAGAMILKAPSALKEGKTVMQILKNPLKSAGRAGKIFAGAVGAVVLASYAVAGKLHANQDTAVIEHKMNVDHRHK